MVQFVDIIIREVISADVWLSVQVWDRWYYRWQLPHLASAR